MAHCADVQSSPVAGKINPDEARVCALQAGDSILGHERTLGQAHTLGKHAQGSTSVGSCTCSVWKAQGFMAPSPCGRLLCMIPARRQENIFKVTE